MCLNFGFLTETSVVQPFRVGDKVILDREENQRRIRQSSFLQHSGQPQGTGVITGMITIVYSFPKHFNNAHL